MDRTALRRSMALVATLALLLTLTAAAPVSAGCRVKIEGYYKTFSSLKTALANVDDGDRLVVKGTCYNSGLVINRDVNIYGVWTRKHGTPTVHAKKESRALSIEGGTEVKITKLTITGGVAGSAAGILNKGNLKLVDVKVTGNTVDTKASGDGGGIVNAETGTLILKGKTAIKSNYAKRNGGGVDNYGLMYMYENATIARNRARHEAGGIENEADATVKMYGQSTVKWNTAGDGHGGVYNHGGGGATFLPNDACGTRIIFNTPTNC